MAVHDSTPALLPQIRIASMHEWMGRDLDSVIKGLRIKDKQLAARFVIDEENPDYLIASDHAILSHDSCSRLKGYLSRRQDCIFILHTCECIDPDLNVFDYAVCWNRDLKCADRITRCIPYIYSTTHQGTDTNTLTPEEAKQILEGNPKFCCFMYSHSSEPRDSFFHLLSQYKHVDSLGKWLNNTGTQSTRDNSDWYSLSIDIKRGYKFSIAMENAVYRGYTTEKIVSSLQAHSVPIYWGDPTVTELINPKAFINCNDYSSFDEVIERVKEIDSNNDLWLDMVTQPWQTEEQYQKTLQIVGDYEDFMHNIFSQDLKSARRRSIGFWGDSCRFHFSGYAGIMTPKHLVALKKIKRSVGKLLPEKAKTAIKHFLRRH